MFSLPRSGYVGRLLVAKNYPMPISHRHFSHLLAIFPLETIRWDDGERARRTIRATLAGLEKLGTDWWRGYSFSWIANVSALARDGEKAEKNPEIFANAFCLRDSFHCNGDQSGKGIPLKMRQGERISLTRDPEAGE